MKKMTLALLATASLLMADAATDKISGLPIIKESGVKVLKVKDLGSIYLVKGEPTKVPEGQEKKAFDFFMTKDYTILLMGQGIAADTKEKVGFPVEKKIIEGKEAFSYGAGKEVLYVFTDPECPYCKEFEKKMALLKDKYTFKIYLYPLPFHTNAMAMSKWILKGKTGAEKGDRLVALANNSVEYKALALTADEDKALIDQIKAQMDVAEAAEVKGTPTVLDKDMKSVNWPAL